jgi:hypothetical protein
VNTNTQVINKAGPSEPISPTNNQTDATIAANTITPVHNNNTQENNTNSNTGTPPSINTVPTPTPVQTKETIVESTSTLTSTTTTANNNVVNNDESNNKEKPKKTKKKSEDTKKSNIVEQTNNTNINNNTNGDSSNNNNKKEGITTTIVSDNDTPGPNPSLSVPQTTQLPTINNKEEPEIQTKVKNKMFAELIIDQDEFKPKSRQGKRAAIQQRLEGETKPMTPETESAEALKERLEKAEERRREAREKRREKAVKDAKQVQEKRDELKQMEEKKAEELKKMIQSKTKVAENNRESSIDVVKIKKSHHHNKVSKVKEVAKTNPKPSSLLGDLPPIGKCLLPGEQPSTSQPDTYPPAPGTLSGLVSPSSPSSSTRAPVSPEELSKTLAGQPKREESLLDQQN